MFQVNELYLLENDTLFDANQHLGDLKFLWGVLATCPYGVSIDEGSPFFGCYFLENPYLWMMIWGFSHDKTETSIQSGPP